MRLRSLDCLGGCRLRAYSGVSVPVMYADVSHMLIVANMFEDIDFTGCWPPAIFPIGGQHPGRRPCAHALRHLGTHLETAVKEVGLSAAYQSGRGVRHVFMVFFDGGNGQYAIGKIGRAHV